MKALTLNSNFKDATDLAFSFKHIEKPKIDITREVLVKVCASGVNPSDALATMGYFDHAQVPRIPGRDFSGMIIEGPEELIGKKVWGSGGEAGISFSGTQAEYIKLTLDAIAEVPYNVDLTIAGGLALPYITAYYSLFKRCQLKEGESCLIVGALGQAGKAGMALCSWKGVKPIALVRGNADVARAETLGWRALDSYADNLSEQLFKMNDGQPINVIFNTIGNLIWDNYLDVLAKFGRIVTLGAPLNCRDVNINLFSLYRANQELIGVNTVSLDFSENATLLNEIKPGFEEGHLSILKPDEMELYTIARATDAYRVVLSGKSKKRVIIIFSEDL